MAARYVQSGTDDVDDSKMSERETGLLLRILSNTAPHTGDNFFPALSREITAACNVRIACITETLLDVSKARITAAYMNNEPMETLEYDLPGTPCEVALDRGTTVYEKGVTALFPTDAWLASVRAEGYVAAPLRSSSGDTIGLLTIIHDAPIKNGALLAQLLEGLAPRTGAELERNQRDNALRRSETRLRLLAEYSRDVLFYYQLLPEPGFKYMNPAIEQVSGYPPEAFLANPETALQIIAEEDRPKVKQAITSGSEEPLAARMITSSGERRWVEYRNFAFHDAEDRVTAVCGTMRDITARVEIMEALQLSEQYRSALLGAIPDTMLRLDAEGTMLDYVSGDSTQIMPHEARELKGRNIRDLLPPHIMAPIREVTRVALQSRRPQRTEFDVSTDHHTTTYEARCVPFRDREALLILRDFTAIKWHEAEEERKRFRDELDVKVERQRTNPYGLTYREIAILHLIAEGQADKQIAESLGISIYTVNKHVGNILGKMTAASRTEAGVRAIREGLVA